MNRVPSDAEPAVDIPLYPDDTVEDLQRCGFRLLQKKRGFRFGMDSVLLAAYAASFCRFPETRPLRIADLGAGCGAVSLLLAARLPAALLTGLELDPASCDALARNCRLNALDQRLWPVQGDIRHLADGTLVSEHLRPHAFDMVVSNPPYRLPEQSWYPGGQPSADARRQAREETAVSLPDILRAAGRLLRPKGRLVLVHRVSRLPDLLAELRHWQLEPKTMRLIQPLPDRAPTTLLLSAVCQGRPGSFVTEPPLLICTQPGIWSPETADLYGLEPPLPHECLYRGLRHTGLAERQIAAGGEVPEDEPDQQA